MTTTRETADPTSLQKMQTSADHAELARLAEAATPGPWKSIIDDTGGERSGWPLCIVPENDDDRSVVRTGGMWPYEWDAKVSQHEAVSTAAFIAAANPAAVLSLLSEIAALRGEVASLEIRRDFFKHNMTQAERQRDELRKALEPFAKAAGKLDGLWSEDDWRWNDSVRSGVTVRDIRRASKALADQGADQ